MFAELLVTFSQTFAKLWVQIFNQNGTSPSFYPIILPSLPPEQCLTKGWNSFGFKTIKGRASCEKPLFSLTSKHNFFNDKSYSFNLMKSVKTACKSIRDEKRQKKAIVVLGA